MNSEQLSIINKRQKNIKAKEVLTLEILFIRIVMGTSPKRR